MLMTSVFVMVGFLMTSCAPRLIMMSPEDHFALGNYYLESKSYGKAKDQFQKIRDDYPASQFATMSQFKLAQTQFFRKQYGEAAIDFALFLEFHPAHKLAPYAKYHLALSKYHDRLSPDRDPSIAQEALIEFNEFIARYPQHPNIEEAIRYKHEIEDHLAMHEFEAGMVYFRRTIYESAIGRFKPIIDEINDADFKAQVLYMIGRSMEMQSKSDKIEEPPSPDDIRGYYQQVIAIAPNSEWAHKAEKKLRDIPVQPAS